MTKQRIYPETVIVDRMYAGKYLDANIGHEIINTFKTDAGENYIYISPAGAISSSYRNTKYVLLVRLINSHCFEVLGYAGDLSFLLSKEAISAQKQRDAGEIDSDRQSEIIEKNSIKYGGIKINELLSEHNNSVFVTFRAGTLRMVKSKRKLYIVDQETLADKQHIFIPGINFSKQSLHMYFDEFDKKPSFEVLTKMIENPEYWEAENTSEKIDISEADETNTGILDIIRKTDDELAYSNWIAYYLQNDRRLLNAFINGPLQVSTDASGMSIKREFHNIDLWMENRDHVIVIENKIKSGINGVDQDRHDIKSEGVSSQLSKYIKTAEEKAEGRTGHFYIFMPDYSYRDEDLTPYLHHEKYKIIRYSELVSFFEAQTSELPYYDDFIKALKKHATEYRKDLYTTMKERFTKEIKAHIHY